MALKPTIYKLKIMLSDLDRNLFETINLTIAQHPSETLERMMIRILAYCINMGENLDFAKGLSVTDEPDLWSKTLDDRISLWIDIGEPSFERVKKASRISETVRIYSFNSKSNVWWGQEKERFAKVKAEVFQIPWDGAKNLALLAARTMDLTVTISEGSAYFSSEKRDCEIEWSTLNS